MTWYDEPLPRWEPVEDWRDIPAGLLPYDTDADNQQWWDGLPDLHRPLRDIRTREVEFV